MSIIMTYPRAELLALAHAFRERVGALLSPIEAQEEREMLAQLKENLGKEEFSAAWASGLAFSNAGLERITLGEKG